MPESIQNENILTPETIHRLCEIKESNPEGFRSASVFLWKKPLKYLRLDEYIRLLKEEGPHEILLRFELFDYLRKFSTPLLSLEELAIQTEKFISFLEVNKEDLITYGRVKPELWPMLPIFQPFAYLYPVDRPAVQYSPTTQFNRIFEDIEKKKLRQLRIGRHKILDIVIDIHKILYKSVQNQTSNHLWLRCLNRLKAGLHYDDSYDISFFRRIEHCFSDLPFTSFSDSVKLYGSETDTKPEWNLTDNPMRLLDNIGHFEKELRIGTAARMGDLLHSPIVFKQLGISHLAIDHYVQIIGCPGRTGLDLALDELTYLREKERKFWKQYQDRINKALMSRDESQYKLDILDYFGMADQLLEPNRILLNVAQVIVSGVRQEAVDNLVATKDKPSIDSQQQEDNVFRKEEGTWTIIYEEVNKSVEHVKGLFYIAFLLEHSNQRIDVVELERIFTKDPSYISQKGLQCSHAEFKNISNEELESQGIRICSTPTASGEVFDEKTAKDLISYYHELRSEGNEEKCNEILEYLTQGSRKKKRRVKKLIDEGKNPFEKIQSDKRGDPYKKSYNAVAGCLQRAIKKIQNKNPSLANHLTLFLKYREYSYFYQPDTPIDWTIEYTS